MHISTTAGKERPISMFHDNKIRLQRPKYDSANFEILLIQFFSIPVAKTKAPTSRLLLQVPGQGSETKVNLPGESGAWTQVCPARCG